MDDIILEIDAIRAALRSLHGRFAVLEGAGVTGARDVLDDLTMHADGLENAAQKLGYDLPGTDHRADAVRWRSLVEAKDALLGAVSHELRSPLASILGYAITIERHDELPEADRAAAVSRIIANAVRMQRALDDLLDLDLFGRGVFDLRRESVDLADVARSAIEEAGVEREADVEREAGVEHVQGHVDRARCVRMITAMLGAVRHEGTRIVVAREGSGAAITVTGETVSADDPLTDRVRLNLSLARVLAEAHGGGLTVEQHLDRTIVRAFVSLS